MEVVFHGKKMTRQPDSQNWNAPLTDPLDHSWAKTESRNQLYFYDTFALFACVIALMSSQMRNISNDESCFSIFIVSSLLQRLVEIFDLSLEDVSCQTPLESYFETYLGLLYLLHQCFNFGLQTVSSLCITLVFVLSNL
jgi:hypothetical protein